MAQTGHRQAKDAPDNSPEARRDLHAVRADGVPQVSRQRTEKATESDSHKEGSQGWPDLLVLAWLLAHTCA
jgi:hypothetical protein